MLQFNFVRTEQGEESIVLVGSQGVRTVGASHVAFERLKENLFTLSEEEAYRLVDTPVTVPAKLRRLSERVTIKGDTLYFDGDEQETKLAEHIVEMIRNDDENWEGYVAFLENLAQNPSKKSRKHLFEFLNKHDLVITEDGHFIAYKGIQDDGLSVTAGSEPVTVTLDDGTVETHTGRIPNPVGAIVEIPRSLVDDNRNVACSVGLHVGNHRYANGFGRVLLTVKVNPRDVVSVPSDSNDEKVRVARYEVVEVNEERRRYGGTSWVPSEYVEDDYEEDEFGF